MSCDYAFVRKEKKREMYPLVSVVIPAYNREKTISRALNSVLEQTYSNIEVIVVDDGSTDSTAKIVSNYADGRVRLICLSSNQGANKARNTGISEAKGEYIAFQDSDDEWLADKLEKQLAYMLKTATKAAYCPYILYDEGKTSVVPSDYMNQDVCEKNVVQTLKKKNVVGTPTLIVRRELFGEIGMFDTDMKGLQDYEFVIRLVKHERLGYIREPLVKAYRMQQSITTNSHRILEAFAQILEKHADFVDVETFLHIYLGRAETLWEDQINWQEFDKIVESVRKSGKAITGEDCYRMAMQYFWKQNWLIKKALTEWYSNFVDNIKAKEFMIYGAGVWGQKAYSDMKKNNCIPKCFAVTERGNEETIDGIPIVTLAEQEDLEMPVIIAVSWEKQDELVKNLLNKGMYRFCIYPFC